MTLTDLLPHAEIVELLSALAAAVPPSGRGLFLFLSVNGAVLSGASRPVRGRMSLSRPPKGKHRYGSYLFCQFAARSKSDAAPKETLQQLGDAMGVTWKKLVAAPELDRTGRPSAEEMALVEQCVQEAFAQAAADLDLVKAPLNGGRQLHSPMAALYKRAGQVAAGVHQKIEFGPEVRQFMQLNFPDYSSCSYAKPAPSFRKRLADKLNGFLVLPNTSRFGKSFTAEYHVDFPGTRLAHGSPALIGRSRSLFSLFHRGTMPPVWAYAVHEDLTEALAGLGNVLRVTLPAIESRLIEFLSPIPESLPPNLSAFGALCAREAYELARWPAKSWSADAQFIGIHSAGLQIIGYELSRGVDLDGRLQPHGCWVVRFQSKSLRAHLLVEVPPSGQIRWNAMDQIAPLVCRPPSSGWLDSPAVMRIAVETIQRLAPEQEWTTWECGILEDRSLLAAVWTIHVNFAVTPRRPSLREVYIYLNPADGALVHSTSRES